MKTLNIDWLTCDSCGGQSIEVETEEGNENWLFLVISASAMAAEPPG